VNVVCFNGPVLVILFCEFLRYLVFGAGITEDEIIRPIFWDTIEGRLAIVNWDFPETHLDWG
jgi:hypothetical protein